MKPGFYTIMAAQFFSSLADNALLVAAIALLAQLAGPAWMVPMLKFFFVVSYVVLAAWVGAFADSRPKGRVMFVTNTIKVGGCLLMLLHQFLVPPGLPEYLVVLAAYAVVGFGAAAYSPAKYGILTELLPPQQLVAANGWIEGTTVGSIILGTVLGGALVSQTVSSQLLGLDVPGVDTFVDSPAEAAIIVIAFFYGVAAMFNLWIPDTGVDHRIASRNPAFLIREFSHCVALLWRDRLGQISLATTTLFWGAGATLQFIVLKWAEVSLGMNLSQAAILQAVVAVGIAFGAVIAATKVTLRQSVSILPVGIAMGLIVMVLAMYERSIGPQGAFDLALGARTIAVPYYVLIACAILMIVGALAGFFVVPMNALLQHRGHVLMGAGHSIAVQNFNENLSILAMLFGYALMIRADLSIKVVILVFGLFVSASMALVLLRHRYNQAQHDSLHLIGMEKPH
ncbi:MAG: lysophospholipid transporter LplT [Burkholderiales bacterium]|nr:lysophospholipid transporter LplT [Burkholderiales bacterium]GIK85284.1 MAG: lysophospholipid transporter LplT [Betaproteobacteria bacterium]